MKKHNWLSKAVVLPLVAIGMLSAQETHAATPDQVALMILSHSPRFVKASGEVFAAEQELRTISNLPDPEIEGEYLFAPSGETNRWGAGISWGLEWPGVYSSRKKAAAGSLETMKAEERVERTNLLSEIGNLLLDYILESKKIELLNQLIVANDSVSVLSQHSFKGGETTRLDLAKLKIDSASLSARMFESEASRSEIVNSLCEIYGEDCTDLLGDMLTEFPEVVIPSRKTIDEALVSSPEILAAWRRLEEARLSAKVVSSESLPAISVGYRHAFEDGIHFNGASLGLSIPVFSNRGKKNAAKVQETLAQLDLEIVRNQVGQTLNNGCKRLEDLNRNIALLAEALDYEADLMLLEKAYKGGVITLIDFINERNYFLEASFDLLSLRHAAARLSITIHSLLPLHL